MLRNRATAIMDIEPMSWHHVPGVLCRHQLLRVAYQAHSGPQVGRGRLRFQVAAKDLLEARVVSGSRSLPALFRVPQAAEMHAFYTSVGERNR
jgi:hypothetical protein